jgi:hypothetical protein
LWNDLVDRVKNRDVAFHFFQKNLIKGIIPVVGPANKFVEAKKRKDQSVPLADVYELTIDALMSFR